MMTVHTILADPRYHQFAVEVTECGGEAAVAERNPCRPGAQGERF